MHRSPYKAHGTAQCCTRRLALNACQQRLWHKGITASWKQTSCHNQKVGTFLFRISQFTGTAVTYQIFQLSRRPALCVITHITLPFVLSFIYRVFISWSCLLRCRNTRSTWMWRDMQLTFYSVTFLSSQIFMADVTEMTVFWIFTPCSIIGLF